METPKTLNDCTVAEWDAASKAVYASQHVDGGWESQKPVMGYAIPVMGSVYPSITNPAIEKWIEELRRVERNATMQAPKHYQDTKLMDLLIEKDVPFAEGNVIKYVYRWKEKDGLKDLYKARDYLLAIIAHAELTCSTEVSK